LNFNEILAVNYYFICDFTQLNLTRLKLKFSKSLRTKKERQNTYENFVASKIFTQA